MSRIFNADDLVSELKQHDVDRLLHVYHRGHRIGTKQDRVALAWAYILLLDSIEDVEDNIRY